jgi:ferritin-like metal-binding protein YciE
MALETLHDLYVDQLKDLYSAENQLVKALPKMAKAASTPKLRSAIEAHLEETKGHVNRLETIFREMKESPKGKKCKAMAGLVEEGAEVIGEDGEPSVRDAGIIAAAQRVEHYEISAYGSARAFAALLGCKEAANLLEETLKEEAQADKKLNEIALNTVNEEANRQGGEESSASENGENADVEGDEEELTAGARNGRRG